MTDVDADCPSAYGNFAGQESSTQPGSASMINRSNTFLSARGRVGVLIGCTSPGEPVCSNRNSACGCTASTSSFRFSVSKIGNRLYRCFIEHRGPHPRWRTMLPDPSGARSVDRFANSRNPSVQDSTGGPRHRTTRPSGCRRALSFDEAFAAAIANLPPSTTHPETLTSVEVVETGGLFGSIADFHHLFVWVRRKGA